MGERELRSATGFGPIKERPDWFWLSTGMVRQLDGSPQVVWTNGRPSAHLSQLPTLNGFPEVTAALATYSLRTSDAERQARDAVTSAQDFYLHDYQHDVVDFIRSRRGSLIALQMRMGKTPAAAASHNPADGPLVVVGPLSVRSVWAREFARRWPHLKAVFLTGLDYDRDAFAGADLIYIHFDVVHAWYSVIRTNPATLIIDEAHLLSNKDANRTTAVSMIAAKAGRVIGLTGTPLWNKPAGLYPILSILADRGFGGWPDFARRYCDGKPGAYGLTADGLSNVDELRTRLESVMLRMTWADVIGKPPSIVRSLDKIALTPAKRREVELLAESARGERSTEIGDLARFRRCVGMIKAQRAVELARRLRDGGDPVVVWTWHKDVAAKITMDLHSVIVTGDMDLEQRDDALDLWRSLPSEALVMTMGVGQAGIDLSHARHAIFAEVDFTPAVLGQSEFRTFAPARKSEITYLCVDHPVDEKLISILITKCGVAAEIGTPASESADDVWREAISDLRGAYAAPDMNRLRDSLLDREEVC